MSVENDMKLVEANLEVANFVAARRDSRQGLEWKMSFAIWTVLIAAIVKGVSVLPLAVALIPLAHGWWLQSVWVRHTADMTIMWKHVVESQKLLERHGIDLPENRSELSRSPAGPWRDRLGFLWGWATLIQFIITLILTLALFATVDKVSWIQLTLRP